MPIRRFAPLFLSLIASACGGQRTSTTSGSASARPAAIAARPVASSAPAPTASSTPDAGAAAVEEKLPDPTFEEIQAVLYTDTSTDGLAAACPPGVPAEAGIRCLFDQRYRGDKQAATLAHELYVKWRIVAGVERKYTMDGGFRGMINLEPAVPIGEHRKHLEWIVAAMRDFDTFFVELERFGKSKETSTSTSTKRYRFKGLTLRFMRSTKMNRPSAYAHDWTIAWNLKGSLHRSEEMARETLFHEIFHLNDAAHGGWSPAALNPQFEPIVKKCGVSIPCLGPYTPNETIVVGGTYYAFQPGNGSTVGEYGAELALRYYREQRAALRSLPKVKAFKCGPPENAKSWNAMRDEFFGGVDAVPACP